MELTDVVVFLGQLFLSGDAPACPDAADADDNGKLEITDAVGILGYLFLAQDPPPAPGPIDCGPDPATDSDELEPCASAGCPVGADPVR